MVIMPQIYTALQEVTDTILSDSDRMITETKNPPQDFRRGILILGEVWITNRLFESR